MILLCYVSSYKKLHKKIPWFGNEGNKRQLSNTQFPLLEKPKRINDHSNTTQIDEEVHHSHPNV